MTITVDDFITKASIINEFNNQVLGTIYSGISWTAYNIPKMSIIHYNNKDYWYTTENVIPNGQLSTQSYLTEDKITSNIIDADIIYNVLTSFVNTCCRVRYTTTRWYFNYAGTYQLRGEMSAKSIYNMVTPVVTGSTTPYFTKNPNITSMTDQLSYDRNIYNGMVVSIQSLNEFFNLLKTAWSNYYNNNPITFNYFTCYYNCYSDYSSRVRR